MLHQKTRELYGPAQDTPTPTPVPLVPETETDKPKPPAPAPAAKKKPVVEIRRAVPNKRSFWSRLRADKSRA